VRLLSAECRLRFLTPNSITLDPDTIAAWPSASSTRRTAIACPPQPLTRAGSAAAQSVALTHRLIRPYSAAEVDSPAGGKHTGRISLQC